MELNNKQLTRRQTQLVQLIQQGFNNKEIAEQLDLTPGTVKTYLSMLYVKLGVKHGNPRYGLFVMAWNASHETAGDVPVVPMIQPMKVVA